MSAVLQVKDVDCCNVLLASGACPYTAGKHGYGAGVPPILLAMQSGDSTLIHLFIHACLTHGSEALAQNGHNVLEVRCANTSARATS